MAGSGKVLNDQIDYYRHRAPEYDEYYERSGPFDLGPEGNRRWRDEFTQVETWLQGRAFGGRALDVAAGTGWWTAALARSCDVTALDAAPEMLELNRRRNAGAKVDYVEADIFAYTPVYTFDTIFFGFWLSHVPAVSFAAFWDRLRAWLAPGGKVLFVDNMESSAPWIQERPADAPESELIVRTLNNGRRFTIVKTHWTPDTLTGHLAGLGWNAQLNATEKYFVFGEAVPGA